MKTTIIYLSYKNTYNIRYDSFQPLSNLWKYSPKTSLVQQWHPINFDAINHSAFYLNKIRMLRFNKLIIQ